MLDYSFSLEFEELSEELQEKKINELIEFNYTNQEYDNINNRIDENGQVLDTLKELQNSERIQEEAREQIKNHFPIYF